MFRDGRPVVSGVRGSVDLAAGGAEVDAAFIERVDGHSVAQYVDVTVALRETFGEFLPFVPAGAAAIDAEFAVEGEMLAVAFDGDDVNRFRLVGVNVDDEAEIGRQVAADFRPGVAGIVTAHDV